MAQAQTPKFGERIREARLRRGISLRGTARRALVSPGALSQIENGRSLPGLSTAERLSGVLDVPVSKLLNEGETR